MVGVFLGFGLGIGVSNLDSPHWRSMIQPALCQSLSCQ